jgi:hypothetical protein
MGHVSMYRELLSTAVAHEEAPVAPVGSGLEVAIECRARMLGHRGRMNGSAQQRLATEVAYDRALVNLCAASGIDVDMRRFDHPEQARERLEGALTDMGIDLGPAALSPRRPAP